MLNMVFLLPGIKRTLVKLMVLIVDSSIEARFIESLIAPEVDFILSA